MILLLSVFRTSVLNSYLGPCRIKYISSVIFVQIQWLLLVLFLSKYKIINCFETKSLSNNST